MAPASAHRITPRRPGRPPTSAWPRRWALRLAIVTSPSADHGQRSGRPWRTTAADRALQRRSLVGRRPQRRRPRRSDMDMESTGTAGSGGATLGGASLDMGSPLEALADAIGEALGMSPEPGSAFT